MNRGAIPVTGTGSGIGASTAQAGYSVCVNYKTGAEGAAKVLRDIEALGQIAIAVQADISIEGEVARLFSLLSSELGPIVGLVNNAAILAVESGYEGINLDRLQRVFATNVAGACLCAKGATNRMRKNIPMRGGGIASEVATAIVFLLSDESPYATGAFTDIGGGT